MTGVYWWDPWRTIYSIHGSYGYSPLKTLNGGKRVIQWYILTGPVSFGACLADKKQGQLALLYCVCFDVNLQRGMCPYNYAGMIWRNRHPLSKVGSIKTFNPRKYLLCSWRHSGSASSLTSGPYQMGMDLTSKYTWSIEHFRGFKVPSPPYPMLLSQHPSVNQQDMEHAIGGYWWIVPREPMVQKPWFSGFIHPKSKGSSWFLNICHRFFVHPPCSDHLPQTGWFMLILSHLINVHSHSCG